MSTTPSDPPTVELDLARRTSVRTIALSSVGALVAVGFFILQALVQTAATEATGVDAPTDEGPPLPILGLFFALILIRSIYDVVSWFARRYTVGDRELVIDEGVITRHHRVVPFSRVQQVDVHQPLVAQALDIAEVRIDTAGEGGTTTMRLRALRRNDAESLRRYILERRAALQHAEPGAANATPTAAVGIGHGDEVERTLVTLTGGRLVLAAITHSTLVIGIPIALVVGVWLLSLNALADGDGRWAFGGGGLALLAFVGVIMLASRMFSMVVGHWGYTLSVATDDIHLKFGLLDVRQLTIPRRRVQQVTVVDNPVRRMLGVVSLTMHSAAGPGGGGKESATRFEVPLLDRANVDDFLASMMGSADWRVPPLEQRPHQAKRRALVRRCLLVALAAVVPAIALFPLGLVALTLVLVGVPWGLVAHGRAGHGRSATLIVFARGALHHLIELVPISRIQSARSDANPLQRQNHLATLHVDIAGDRSAPRLYDMDEPTASALLRALPRASATGAARPGGRR